MTKQEAWKLFGLPPGSGEKEIRQRYTKLAVRYHPEEDPEMFAQIHEAYLILEGKGGDVAAVRQPWPGESADVEQRSDDEWDGVFGRLEEQYDLEQKRKAQAYEKALERLFAENSALGDNTETDWKRVIWKQDPGKREEDEKKIARAEKAWRKKAAKKENVFGRAIGLAMGTSVILFGIGALVFYWNFLFFDALSEALEFLFFFFLMLGELAFFFGAFFFTWVLRRYTLKEYLLTCFGKNRKPKKLRTKILLVLGGGLLLTGLFYGLYQDVTGMDEKYRCGEQMSWRLEKEGLLRVTGEGNMWNFHLGTAPWAGIRSRVRKVVLSEGVTGVGSYAFSECENLVSVEFPESLTWLGERAFDDCESLRDVYYAGDVPLLGGKNVFGDLNDLIVYFPEGNDTWTEEVMTSSYWDWGYVPSLWTWVSVGPSGEQVVKSGMQEWWSAIVPGAGMVPYAGGTEQESGR